MRKTNQRMIPSVALTAFFTMAAVAFATTATPYCWNGCTLQATDWMNDTGASYEEASEYFNACLEACNASEIET